jgi:hypothetical protein
VLLAELAALDARLLEKLAVLLLGHALAPLLDDRTHEIRPFLATDVRRPDPHTLLAGCEERGIESDQWIAAADGLRQPAL